MYVCSVILRRMCVCSYDVSIHYRLIKLARKKIASLEKPAIHLKYNNSRVTSFFDVLGKANHLPYCADEVILTPRAANYWLIFIYRKKRCLAMAARWNN